jgi:hypothetical protein
VACAWQWAVGSLRLIFVWRSTRFVHQPCLGKNSLYKAAFAPPAWGSTGARFVGRIFVIRFPVSPPSLVSTSLTRLEGLSADQSRAWNKERQPHGSL